MSRSETLRWARSRSGAWSRYTKRSSSSCLTTATGATRLLKQSAQVPILASWAKRHSTKCSCCALLSHIKLWRTARSRRSEQVLSAHLQLSGGLPCSTARLGPIASAADQHQFCANMIRCLEGSSMQHPPWQLPGWRTTGSSWPTFQAPWLRQRLDQRRYHHALPRSTPWRGQPLRHLSRQRRLRHYLAHRWQQSILPPGPRLRRYGRGFHLLLVCWARSLSARAASPLQTRSTSLPVVSCAGWVMGSAFSSLRYPR
mmetsp:Transcript_94815/g.239015  ORF Transcript_94815/g.239015 Transcript_94815/m.239015 type:complete len:257 (-) Transcript_94815:216-986(-)